MGNLVVTVPWWLWGGLLAGCLWWAVGWLLTAVLLGLEPGIGMGVSRLQLRVWRWYGPLMLVVLVLFFYDRLKHRRR